MSVDLQSNKVDIRVWGPDEEPSPPVTTAEKVAGVAMITVPVVELGYVIVKKLKK